MVAITNTVSTNVSSNTVSHSHHHSVASAGAILAVDLGKYKSVACVHDQATGEFGFTTFETTRREVRRLLEAKQPAVVVIEACLPARSCRRHRSGLARPRRSAAAKRRRQRWRRRPLSVTDS
jgi:hypothetical protein